MKNYKNIIQENFPELEIHIIEKLGAGWVNEAVLVNNEWVFRFPKTAAGAKDLEKEIRILPHLTGIISLAIPDFEYIGKQENGLYFVGYKLLPGEILGEESFHLLKKEEQETIAKQIAEFITQVSGFPLNKAKKLEMPERDFKQDYAETFEEVKEKIFPLIDADMQKYLSARFESYLNNPQNFQYQPVLVHGDLSPNHWLINPLSHKLTGIIDFGDIEIGDPDWEYAYLLEDCGEQFARRVMKLRGEKDVEKCLQKVSIFVTVDHTTAISEGLRRGDTEMVAGGIEALQREISSL